ncbi:hypothetical protein FXO38_11853 [Capsicum annuum]|nr:hypothetical protein FXO38_11853 [Capsicum annuum]KAF3668590.1 hypothetical protein FXO37_09464 [Capsicum annuum]
MNVENPWTITKIITDFEKSVKILVLSLEDMKNHIFKHWMKGMVKLIKKGNKQEVELVDVTDVVNSKNHRAFIQMMEPSKDYAIACNSIDDEEIDDKFGVTGVGFGIEMVSCGSL